MKTKRLITSHLLVEHVFTELIQHFAHGFHVDETTLWKIERLKRFLHLNLVVILKVSDQKGEKVGKL